MICGIEFMDWAVKLGKGVNELSFWCNYDSAIIAKLKPMLAILQPVESRCPHSVKTSGVGNSTETLQIYRRIYHMQYEKKFFSKPFA